MTDCTLYCDASFDHENLVGAWAIWLRCEYGRIIRTGACPDYCRDSMHAELSAIFAGLHVATQAWPTVSTVLIRSDCQSALNLIQKGVGNYNPGIERLVERIVHLQIDTGLGLRMAWVRGHQDLRSTKPDAYINRQVDEMARGAMRALRKGKPNFICHHKPLNDRSLQTQR